MSPANTEPRPVHTPRAGAEPSQARAFAAFYGAQIGADLPDYFALQRESVRDFRGFWRSFLAWSGLPVAGAPEPVCVGDVCETAVFFPELRLSYAEALLRCDTPADEERPAVTARSEDGSVQRLTRGALRQRVAGAARALRALGVGPGDRVVAIARNDAAAIVACLATVSLGASWSATAPDLGAAAIAARFAPLAPKVLLFHGDHPYHGVRRPLCDRVAEVARALPSLTALVPLTDEALGDGMAALQGLPLQPPLPPGEPGEPFAPQRFPFNHPLFILFSSGTTGPPKCIVHGAGGTLLEHHKEHRLHGDLRPGDKLFFQTSCGWMMWNWLLSALACRAEIIVYDGSVSYPDEDALWRLCAEERVTHFGTSPAFLQYTRDAAIVPRERFGSAQRSGAPSIDLSSLRAVLSTGSILPAPLYDFVASAVADVPLQSISGGTDIIGCFVLGYPDLPVYAGESQSLSLGLDVRAMPPGHFGELTCHNPFPSRPLGLYGDADGRRFHDAYFSQHEGVWTHGDFLELTPRGGARILGRSDGVMNIRGIRIGPAEIYQALEAVPEITASLAIEQQKPDEPGGSRLVLLVVLAAGRTLDRPLTLRIKRELSQRLSLVHVPSVIAQVTALPTTHSGKRSERAARDALNGREVANLAALRNPESLDELRQHPALQVP